MEVKIDKTKTSIYAKILRDGTAIYLSSNGKAACFYNSGNFQILANPDNFLGDEDVRVTKITFEVEKV